MPWVMLICLVCNDCYSLIASNHLIRPPHRGGVRSNTCSLSVSAWEGVKPWGAVWSMFLEERPEPHLWRCAVGGLWTRRPVSWRRMWAAHNTNWASLPLPPFLPPPLDHLLGLRHFLSSIFPSAPSRCLVSRSAVCGGFTVFWEKDLLV